jgi:hypothetical protein
MLRNLGALFGHTSRKACREKSQHKVKLQILGEDEIVQIFGKSPNESKFHSGRN